MFPLRLRRRVDPYPFLDIRLINERQYDIKEDNHIWCIIHTRFHAGCLPDVFVPLDHVNANANVSANNLASSYTCGHPRIHPKIKAEEAQESIAVFTAEVPKGEITP